MRESSKTEILDQTPKSIKKAANFLNNDELVSFPTETVYGLAGNAYSKYSISRIYKLKKRPKLNPLIVHYYDYKKAVNDVIFCHFSSFFMHSLIYFSILNRGKFYMKD